MKKKLLAPLFLTLLPFTSLMASEATILKVSKTINSKNVLHYKVKFDEKTCELNGDIFADWKMDEEDGRWKSLDESSSFIKGPLQPESMTVSGSEVIFTTESMGEFSKKKIIDQEQVVVRSDFDKNGTCKITNEIMIKGNSYHVSQLHSKVTIFGSVKWVEITAEDERGKKVKMKF